jgi:hypothetical protein
LSPYSVCFKGQAIDRHDREKAKKKAGIAGLPRFVLLARCCQSLLFSLATSHQPLATSH